MNEVPVLPWPAAGLPLGGCGQGYLDPRSASPLQSPLPGPACHQLAGKQRPRPEMMPVEFQLPSGLLALLQQPAQPPGGPAATLSTVTDPTPALTSPKGISGESGTEVIPCTRWEFQRLWVYSVLA